MPKSGRDAEKNTDGIRKTPHFHFPHSRLTIELPTPCFGPKVLKVVDDLPLLYFSFKADISVGEGDTCEIVLPGVAGIVFGNYAS